MRPLVLTAAFLLFMVLNGCDSGSPEPETGVVSGTVFQAANGMPLWDVVVSIDDITTTTAADGIFTLEGVPLGQQLVSVSRSEFASNAAYITVVEGPNSLDINISALVTLSSIDMEMLLIPPGTFTMGSANGSVRETPHEVTLTNDVWIGRYEVTQREYHVVTGKRPSAHSGDDRLPVESVTWLDAIAFANALSVAEGLTPCYFDSGIVIGGDIYQCSGYRLPTEAEWEYATRANTTTEYSYGSDDPGRLGDYAWYRSNSGSRTHAVGGKQPNPWGLFDVHGNVLEWVHDWYPSSSGSSAAVTNPRGAPEGAVRVIRGGGWRDHEASLRSADRVGFNPTLRAGDTGFRLARAAR